MLNKRALLRSVAEVRGYLGKSAGELDRVIPLVREDGKANLADVLGALYPHERAAPAQAKLRQLRLAITKGAEKAEVRFELAGDRKTRSAPNERQIWFEGDDLLLEATEKWVAPSVTRPDGVARVAQDAVELGPARIYVVYAENDAHDAKKLLEALEPHLKAADIATWSRADVLPGENRDAELERQRRRCRLTLQLWSPEFVAAGLKTDRTACALPAMLHEVAHPPDDCDVFRLNGNAFGKSKARDFALALFHKIEEVLRRRELAVTEDLKKLTWHDIHFVPGAAASVSLERELEAQGAVGRADALEQLNDWLLSETAPPYCALFGETGMGKTTTAKEFASRLWQRRRDGEHLPAAVFIDLRHVGDFAMREPDLDEIVARALKQNWKGGPTSAPPEPQEIYQLVEQGGLVIFDGLDEVLVHLTPSQGQAFTRQLFRMAPPGAGRGRLLFTCRTHYFRTFKEQSAHFTTEDRDSVRAESYRALLLLPFGEEQIRTYLRHSMPDRDTEQTYAFIESVHNLPELAERPYTLSLIARQFRRLEEWKASGRRVLGLTLYRFVVEEWLLRDTGKHQLTPEHKQMLMEHIAAELVRAGTRTWAAGDLEQWLLDFLDSNRRVASHYEGVKRELLKEDLRTATFLVRDEQDRFRFAHTSLQEYFLAGYLRRAMEAQDFAAWALRGVSPETLDFLGQSLLEQPSAACLQGLTALRGEYRNSSSELAFRYVLLALARGYPAPAVAGFQLAGAELFGLEVDHAGPGLLDLSGLNLRGARVANTFWRRCRMAGSDFTGADAARAEWQDCDLARTKWEGAELEGGLMRRCELRESELGGARTHRMRRLLCGEEKREKRRGRVLVQTGHADAVNSCAWSPDGGRVASASDDGTVKIWDAASGECARTLSGHSAPVRGCAWSPDGGRVASASEDATVKIWDAASGECARTLSGHSGLVNGCAWSPDGGRVATASSDGTVKIWDVASGECARTLSGHSSWVNGCAWSPDGGRVASAAADGTVKIWDAASAECARTLSGHSGWVNGCAWSREGGRVASASYDGTVKIWDAASGECARTLSGHSGRVMGCAWSPDGGRVASASVDRTVKIWDTASGECARTLSSHSRSVNGCAWSPDGGRVASASYGGTVKIWDAASGECARTLSGHSSSVSNCAWSRDGGRLASASDDGTVKIWDAASGECARTLSGHSRSVNGCAWSPDGGRVASASYGGTVKIWDAASGECARTLLGHLDWVRGCAWSPDGERVASASYDGTVKIWDAECGECARTLSGHSEPVNGCAWSPDGGRVASASFDRTVKIWDAASEECARTLSGHSGPVNWCAWSPDGGRVASASYDRTVKIWDAASGECARTLSGHSGFVRGCAWSPDGARVASASDDWTVKIWDAASGECRATLQVDAQATGCTWHMDGRLAVSLMDGSISLYRWDEKKLVETGPRMYHLMPPHSGPTWASIDPVGNRILGYGEGAWRSVGYAVLDENGAPAWLPVEAFEED